MPQSINTYIKGMNKDKSFLKTDPAEYLDMRNFRVVTDEGGSTGAIVNEKGMKEDFCFPLVRATYGILEPTTAAGDTITIDGTAHVITGTTPKEIHDELTAAYATLISNGTLDFYFPH